MAGSVNFDRLVDELQRTMALEKSSSERPFNYEDDGDDCHGHGCYRADCCQGYGHHLAGGYGGDHKRQVPGEDYAELRHPHNRWRL